MRKLTKILISVFMVQTLSMSSSPVAATAIAGTPASPASPDTRYTISVQLDTGEKTLTGSETVTYKSNYDDTLKDLCLHLYPDSFSIMDTKPSISTNIPRELTPEEIGWIEVSSVKVDGMPVSFTDKDQLLRIQLDKPLSKGNTASIEIGFQVKIPAGTDRLGYKDDVYSITNWYPIMSIYDQASDSWDTNEFNPVGESNYSDVADYKVSVTAPSDIVIASTGQTVGASSSGDLKTTVLSSSKTRDFVFMMSKRYKSLVGSWDGIKVTSYYLSDKGTTDSVDTARHLLGVVLDSLKFYSNAYGKYPYPELKIAETYLSGGAMEYPALIQMGEYEGLTKDSMQNHSSWLEDAAAHETGHQWWYVTVGNNEYSEPVMDESINTFSTAYYFEKRYGKGNPNSSTQKIRSKLNEEPNKPINSPVSYFSSWNEYQKVIYVNGAEAFQDVMMRTGEEKFLKVLKTYYERYKFKNGSIDAFANVLGEIAGKDIRTHFINAINDEEYYPENIALTPAEVKFFKNLDELSDLELREESLGTNISSILIRAIKGEKITFVLPSKASPAVYKAASSYATKMKTTFKNNYNINVDIIKDTAVTEKLKTTNLILVGNNETNLLMNQFKTSLPLKVDAKDAYIGKTKAQVKNISAIYAVNNPKNKKNILLVIYWKDNLRRFNFIEDNYDQYIVNYSEQYELRGGF